MRYKKVRTYSIRPETEKLVEKLARFERRNKSTIIDIAIEELAARRFSHPKPLITVEKAEEALEVEA